MILLESYFNMFDNSLLCISDYVLDREHVPYHFVDCSILFEFEQVDEKQFGMMMMNRLMKNRLRMMMNNI